jgi:cytochrome c oxidase cbb3-type subunit 1
MDSINNIPAIVTENEGIPFQFSLNLSGISILLILLLSLILLKWAYSLLKRLLLLRKESQMTESARKERFNSYILALGLSNVENLLKRKQSRTDNFNVRAFFIPVILALFFTSSASAQTLEQQSNHGLLNQTGIIITIVLLAIPTIAAFVLMIVKIKAAIKVMQAKNNSQLSDEFINFLDSKTEDELKNLLDVKNQQQQHYIKGNELSGNQKPVDNRGLLEIEKVSSIPFVATKKKAQKRPEVDKELSKLVLWFLFSATFWLVFGTSIGEYVGIKFIAPDSDQLSWLSFGRLRPVHTNAVFWGWASMAMLGLGHYVVPRVSNVKIYSIKAGWYCLWCINTAVLLGSISLMAGINNGGGEYREYIWPIMSIFAIGIIIAFVNFFRTVATRTTKEIYISNWYIVSALIFVLVITIVAYLPAWQDGLGETIVQGYYMHQGVGMWFMLFTLGLVYYFLPQQLNKPVYSYSLGILAFWAQILFYTTIGTHHFVFSAIPWWLQTVAIVGSVGMVIPVVAGTTNFLMTIEGSWNHFRHSYTLPFFLVGIIFYFTGSLQGTAEAFRYTNLIWHFTDFTVAHSHLTMYGIISFLLWGCVYAIVPRITGKEASQAGIGAHFWLSLLGLLFYTVPLMYGSTLRGLMWMDGKPFIDSVSFMAPFWLWRAVGGSFMWLSHLFFAYNLYKMSYSSGIKDMSELNRENLEKQIQLTENTQA